MISKTHKLLIIISLILIVAFAFIFYASSNNFERNNITIISYSDDLTYVLDSYKTNNDFLLIFDFKENDALNNYMFNSMLTLSVVLVAHDKNAITFLKVVNADSELVSCSSNMGNYDSEINFSVDECNAFLDSSNAVKIILERPLKSLSKSQIKLYENEIYITPTDYTNISNATFTLAELLYSDAETIVGQSNDLIHKLGA
ncbi:MAG: hypothetical protein V1672_03740 [Candidatus Diapherotrites archaeon]